MFWHEQNEDGLHEYPSFEMPLCYGVAKKNASDQEIADTANTIISAAIPWLPKLLSNLTKFSVT